MKHDNEDQTKRNEERKPYERPRLERAGTLLELTQGHGDGSDAGGVGSGSI